MTFWVIFAFIFALISLILVIVFYYFQGNKTNTWSYIQGTAGDPKFTANNQVVYSLPINFSGSVLLKTPEVDPTGFLFIVNNTANNTAITLTSDSGVVINGNTVKENSGNSFIWQNKTTIQKVT